jgi:hypothetical protein
MINNFTAHRSVCVPTENANRRDAMSNHFLVDGPVHLLAEEGTPRRRDDVNVLPKKSRPPLHDYQLSSSS